MTDGKIPKKRKLSYEILGLIGISAVVAVVLFGILFSLALAVAEEYIFYHDIPMTEFDWMEMDRWIFGVTTLIAVSVFSILFLQMLADRITYIRKITGGIDALGMGKQQKIELSGNNELTDLANAINQMSEAQRQLREKEAALAEEKDQLIHALSHDIRTPLTSILAYSDYLVSEEVTGDEQRQYLRLIRKKAEQIRDLTGILLEGSKRKLEYFDDGKLLMEQLVAEFEEGLEDRFQIHTDLSGCPKFSGSFDVQELRRIFDNLGSNVQKYAEPAHPVKLEMLLEEGCLIIRQRNAKRADSPASDGYGIGLNSIRRIAQHYDGKADVEQTQERFEITIALQIS